MEKVRTLRVEEDEPPKRLDLYISEKLPGLTRSAIKGMLKEGLIRVENLPAKPSKSIRPGQTIRVTLKEPPPALLLPEPIPLDIIYEDDDILVLDKPRGITVHPGAGRMKGTLAAALLYHTRALSSVGGSLRPGIVHRLDKDTSGILVVAKTNLSHINLSKQFKEHSTLRRYHALVWGRVEENEGAIELPIGRDVSDRKKISARTRKGRSAATRFKTLKRYPWFTLLEVTPKTGRTHQIRVHLLHIKHPVVGDPVYGRKTLPPLPEGLLARIRKLKGQLLHAVTLGIQHPSTKKFMEFTSPYPDDMEEFLKALDNITRGGGRI